MQRSIYGHTSRACFGFHTSAFYFSVYSIYSAQVFMYSLMYLVVVSMAVGFERLQRACCFSVFLVS